MLRALWITVVLLFCGCRLSQAAGYVFKCGSPPCHCSFVREHDFLRIVADCRYRQTLDLPPDFTPREIDHLKYVDMRGTDFCSWFEPDAYCFDILCDDQDDRPPPSQDDTENTFTKVHKISTTQPRHTTQQHRVFTRSIKTQLEDFKTGESRSGDYSQGGDIVARPLHDYDDDDDDDDDVVHGVLGAFLTIAMIVISVLAGIVAKKNNTCRGRVGHARLQRFRHRWAELIRRNTDHVQIAKERDRDRAKPTIIKLDTLPPPGAVGGTPAAQTVQEAPPTADAPKIPATTAAPKIPATTAAPKIPATTSPPEIRATTTPPEIPATGRRRDFRATHPLQEFPTTGFEHGVSPASTPQGTPARNPASPQYYESDLQDSFTSPGHDAAGMAEEALRIVRVTRAQLKDQTQELQRMIEDRLPELPALSLTGSTMFTNPSYCGIGAIPKTIINRRPRTHSTVAIVHERRPLSPIEESDLATFTRPKTPPRPGSANSIPPRLPERPPSAEHPQPNTFSPDSSEISFDAPDSPSNVSDSLPDTSAHDTSPDSTAEVIPGSPDSRQQNTSDVQPSTPDTQAKTPRAFPPTGTTPRHPLQTVDDAALDTPRRPPQAVDNGDVTPNKNSTPKNLGQPPVSPPLSAILSSEKKDKNKSVKDSMPKKEIFRKFLSRKTKKSEGKSEECPYDLRSKDEHNEK